MTYNLDSNCLYIFNIFFIYALRLMNLHPTTFHLKKDYIQYSFNHTNTS